MTIVFGLTGGIASGKSTVAGSFRRASVPMIDADQLAREVVAKGSEGFVAIRKTFGDEVLTEEGDLDRARLGRLVFHDPDALARLNAITHPLVGQLFRARVAALREQGVPLIGYEVPLLFENRLEQSLRPVVLVACPEDVQLERAVQRDGLSREEAEARIRAQMPLAEKRRRADYVIENDGTRLELEQRAAEVLEQIRDRSSAALRSPGSE